MSVAAHPALSDRAARIDPGAYLELLLNLTRREVKGRYSQTLFGVGWAIAQPLAMMAVFTLVFARLANVVSGQVPYPIFAYAALVPWFFFSNSVASGTMSLITYRNIVTKTYFPREIVPLAQIGSRFVDIAAASGLYVLLMIYYGIGVGAWGVLVPFFLLLLLMFTVAVTLITSALMCLFGWLKDVMTNYLTGRVLADLRNRIARHLPFLPLRYHYDRKSGDLVSRVTNDVSVTEAAVHFYFDDLIVQPITALCALGMILFTNWRLAAIALGFFLVYAVFMSRRHKYADLV